MSKMFSVVTLDASHSLMTEHFVPGSPDGLDELLRDFSAIAELPDMVAEDMLNAEADVLVEAQKATAGSMLTSWKAKATPTARASMLSAMARGNITLGLKLASTGQLDSRDSLIMLMPIISSRPKDIQWSIPDMRE